VAISDESVSQAAEGSAWEDSAQRDFPVAADLVREYGDLVFNLSVRLTGDREQARDLAQDAFLRILKGAGSYRGDASLRTWIFQVVLNCHRNNARWWSRPKRGRTVSLDEPLTSARAEEEEAPSLGSTLPDASPGPDRLFEGREARSRVETELMRLPWQQRATMILREVEGLSYKEIAVALRVREGTVRSRLARARETLRLALADLASRGERA